MEENVPRDLLETMGHSVEWIALHVGFGSPTNLRYGFERLVRTSPRAYPRAAQNSTTTDHRVPFADGESAGTAFRIWNGGVGSLEDCAWWRAHPGGTNGSERTSMSEESGGSPLKGEMGSTTISSTVVSQIAGIAAQEVENAQMGGGASAAVGGILQSVTGGSSGGGNYSRGVSVEVGEEEAAVDLTMTVNYGQAIPRITEAVRSNVIKRVENLTGLRVTEVNIVVSDVQVPQEQQA
jgi:uncharacterized alkaline shock family protein YloU